MWSAASFMVSSITKGAHSLTVLFTLADGFSFWLIGVYGLTTDSENWLIGRDSTLSDGHRKNPTIIDLQEKCRHSILLLNKGILLICPFRMAAIHGQISEIHQLIPRLIDSYTQKP